MLIDPVSALLKKYAGGIKFLAAYACALALLGAAILFYLNPEARGPLLLITPKSPSAPGVTAGEIEKINGGPFLITYACDEAASARAVNSTAGVTVRATNFSRPHVLRLVMKSGSFFTKEQQERRAKVAVLNEKAASELFGGADIPGVELTLNRNGVSEKYRVAGVVSDGGDSLNVYVPVTPAERRVNEFAVRLEGGVSEAVVKNELKRAGVAEGEYEFERGGWNAAG